MTTTEPADLDDLREFWEREVAAAWLYRALAEQATDDATAKVLQGLARTEDRHVRHWEDLLRSKGLTEFPQPRIPLRERTLAWAARRFGVDKVIPLMVRVEAGHAGMYEGQPDAADTMAAEELAMARTLADLTPGGSGSSISRSEGRHRTRSGGALRAATFGINDGLVSNLALVMGVAGGVSDNSFILLAGVAGLIAGAMSMAAGEWVSVRSQRELYEREIQTELEELRQFPDEERRELTTIFEAKGVGAAQASDLAGKLMADEDVAIDTLAREELGLDPDELGNPWVAAVSSFVAFAVGASLPVLPFVFASGTAATVAAIVVAALALGTVGLAISILTGRSALFSAARMMAIGLGAAAITYGVGRLIGVSVG